VAHKTIKTIAIVGSGIAGLTAAHLLHQEYDITVFEKNSYPGGHAHTVTVSVPSGAYDIDTGFIVFNKVTYPHFTRLLNQLNIPIKKSEMSFSFTSTSLGLEYSSNWGGLLAQKKIYFGLNFIVY